ncbi:FecR family protein [Olivibacter sitiensis]|uniref:FecR family protein n=1 Tax=Olivibacter sitiensis TaxID=376470 RepID=UPI0003F5D22E|nr:FecR family protein [Olivibacter sitiensis]
MEGTKLKRLIERYRKGKANAAERLVVDWWYSSLLEKSEQHEELAEQVDMVAFQEEIIQRAHERPKTVAWYRKTWLRPVAAAGLFCCLSLTWLLLRHDNTSHHQAADATYTVVETGIRQVKLLKLPDSSIVYLNANSRLKIPAEFDKTHRDLQLEGEAFFEVASDPSLPFRIAADSLQVVVLGTKFNVQSYKNLDNIRVQVIEGRVQVNRGAKQLALLGQQEQMEYNRQTELAFTGRSSAVPNTWTRGVLVLDRASFGEVGQAMYNLYGIQLRSSDSAVLNRKYNFTIRSIRTLGQTLEQLTELINKQYKKEGDEIILY